MNPPLHEIYDHFAETYDASRGLFDMSGILKPFFDGLRKPTGHLLDLGCGAGEPFPRYFIDHGWTVQGVDFSQKMIHLAARYTPEMQTLCADIRSVDFTPESFDAITSIYSLFHIPRTDHSALFANLHRWLRPGGQILFTYATKEYTGHEEFDGYKEFLGQTLFYSHTTPKKLHAELDRAGLRTESATLHEIGGESFLWVIATKPRPLPPARSAAP